MLYIPATTGTNSTFHTDRISGVHTPRILAEIGHIFTGIKKEINPHILQLICQDREIRRWNVLEKEDSQFFAVVLFGSSGKCIDDLTK
jgi:hypothetical protein